MMKTANYGVNGSDINELGQRLPPMQVYGKYEPHGSYAASAARGLDEGLVKDLISRFRQEHGILPRVYFAPSCMAPLTYSSFNVRDIGYCFLQIKYDGSPERVE